MYIGKILSAVENSNNPDQITVVVEYNDSEAQKTFTRQYDWISSTLTAESVDITIKDELRRMNTDTPTILQALTTKIGQEISV